MERELLLAYPLLPLILSAVIDTRTGRIPNALTFPAIAAGLGLTLLFQSGAFFAQCCIVIAFLFILGAVGMTGMGDIKLMMAVASVAGAFLTALMIAVAAVILIVHGFLADRKGTIRGVRAALWAIGTGNDSFWHTPGKRWPFAPYLACGYIVAAFWGWMAW